ncbi:putative O-glycosylation ligase, exosortase A system-associated [Oceanibacterium hippocampi]|uniref:O-Antigen ligase n=1 Tax=Oceanibacterium hippocampi TaxID=745714 RepID=A0A1Y5TSI7_9PROT|nr:putative O-glycosylation ligase, exosortase A system-associated [Oceanibacterium hippocampi]SLN69192.1 O-Antigen ligase [Oceanibacterium hippocampi]
MLNLMLIGGVFGMLVLAFFGAHVGILTWAWISFMHPHRLVWGGDQFQLTMISSLAAMFIWLVSREPKRLPMNSTMVIFIIFLLHATLTTVTAYRPGYSVEFLITLYKTFLMLFMIMATMHTKARLHAMIWLMAISIGYYAIQGSIGFLTGSGSHHFSGPPKTYIYDRNHLAIAFIMAIPLFNYLRMNTAKRFIQLGCMGVMFCAGTGVIATQSRGGFVAMAVMLVLFWLRSGRNLLMPVMVVLLMVPALMLAPQEWTERMQTIEHATEDGSFSGRLDAWYVAWRIAKERPLTGGGINATQLRDVFFRFVPDSPLARAAHSVYFQTLGDHGFVGLIIWTSFGFIAWRNLGYVRRRCKDEKGLEWARDLASMMQVSLGSFYVGAAALSLAYYDYFLTFIALAAVLRQVIEREFAGEAAVPYGRRTAAGIAQPTPPAGSIPAERQIGEHPVGERRG